MNYSHFADEKIKARELWNLYKSTQLLSVQTRIQIPALKLYTAWIPDDCGIWQSADCQTHPWEAYQPFTQVTIVLSLSLSLSLSFFSVILKEKIILTDTEFRTRYGVVQQNLKCRTGLISRQQEAKSNKYDRRESQGLLYFCVNMAEPWC